MLNSKDYQKLFHIGLPYLVSDLFAQHYKTLKCLLVAENGLWTSYLPKEVIAQTLLDGQKLFADNNLFANFESDFNTFIQESKLKFQEILGQEPVKESSENFLQTVASFWKFYSKTEFFYTDGVVNVEQSEILTNHLKRFEIIKNDGRVAMNSMIFEADSLLNRFLNSISSTFNVPVEDLKFYSINEVLSLFDGVKTSEEKLVNRKAFYFMIGSGSDVEYGEGVENKKKFESFFMLGTGELKGNIANNGKVLGRVKIFPPSYYSDFSILPKLFVEMKKGDILVAETTSPELMPACAKAGAIVTNQGGLLSHAAIVSRELGIPCIVNVTDATSILVNGDMVEVDADNGVVRIIK